MSVNQQLLPTVVANQGNNPYIDDTIQEGLSSPQPFDRLNVTRSPQTNSVMSSVMSNRTASGQVFQQPSAANFTRPVTQEEPCCSTNDPSYPMVVDSQAPMASHQQRGFPNAAGFPPDAAEYQHHYQSFTSPLLLSYKENVARRQFLEHNRFNTSQTLAVPAPHDNDFADSTFRSYSSNCNGLPFRDRPQVFTPSASYYQSQSYSLAQVELQACPINPPAHYSGQYNRVQATYPTTSNTKSPPKAQPGQQIPASSKDVETILGFDPCKPVNVKNIPCEICGDQSSGSHYGVLSCEGCKGFFRRSLKNQHSYTCQNGNKCEITRFTRNKCQSCRFMKCEKMGMSQASAKFGRRTKRANEGLKYKALKSTLDRVLDENPNMISHPSVNRLVKMCGESNSSMLFDTDVALFCNFGQLFHTQMQQPIPQQIGHGQELVASSRVIQTASHLPSSGEINSVQNFFSSVALRQGNNPSQNGIEVPGTSEHHDKAKEVIQPQRINGFLCYNEPGELFDEILSSNTYTNRFLVNMMEEKPPQAFTYQNNHEIPDAQASAEFFLLISQEISKELHDIANFSLGISAFRELPPEDHFALMKEQGPHILLIRLASRYNSKTKTIQIGDVTFPFQCFHYFCQILPLFIDFVRALEEAYWCFVSLRLTNFEAALLSAMCLFSPERLNMKAEKVLVIVSRAISVQFQLQFAMSHPNIEKNSLPGVWQKIECGFSLLRKIKSLLCDLVYQAATEFKGLQLDERFIDGLLDEAKLKECGIVKTTTQSVNPNCFDEVTSSSSSNNSPATPQVTTSAESGFESYEHEELKQPCYNICDPPAQSNHFVTSAASTSGYTETQGLPSFTACWPESMPSANEEIATSLESAVFDHLDSSLFASVFDSSQ